MPAFQRVLTEVWVCLESCSGEHKLVPCTLQMMGRRRLVQSVPCSVDSVVALVRVRDDLQYVLFLRSCAFTSQSSSRALLAHGLC